MAIQFKAGKPEASQFFVPEGDYTVRVIEAEQDTSKAGNEMIKLKLRVRMADGSEGPALFDYLVFNEKCFWKVDAFLKACGRHPGEGSKVDIEADDLIGYECYASIVVEKHDGKKSNKVGAYLFDEF